MPAVDNLDGSVREGPQVAEVTGLLRDRLDRGGWPKNLRVFVRRRRLPPGRQHILFDLDGYAYCAFATVSGKPGNLTVQGGNPARLQSQLIMIGSGKAARIGSSRLRSAAMRCRVRVI